MEDIEVTLVLTLRQPEILECTLSKDIGVTLVLTLRQPETLECTLSEIIETIEQAKNGEEEEHG